ncbi:MAG: hypothetical protein ACM3WV_03910 [Bacillota bacterium]
MTTIKMRPHHFIDILVSIGEGQRKFEPVPAYGGSDLNLITHKIWNDRNIIFDFLIGADDICHPCRHNIDGVCNDTFQKNNRTFSKHRYNEELDIRWLNQLGFKEGMEMKARDFCKLVREKAGDMTSIYQHDTKEEVEIKKENLLKGIAVYLEEAE